MGHREMDNSQSLKFLDSGKVLGPWPIWDEDSIMSHMDNTVLTTTPSFRSEFYNQGTIIDYPLLGGNTLTSIRSQAPPPAPFGEAAHPQTISATTNDTLDFSPNLPSPSYAQEHLLGGYVPYLTDNRVMREPKPRQSTFITDAAANFRHYRSAGVFEIPNESLRLDIDNNGRNHPLYQNVALHDNGLYHCPWEGQEECKHQPVKLKCEYDKQVDSHLKPYRCKVAVCGNPRFSSAPILLRHEREAHGMHGHGDKPHLCTHEGCERSVPGNGFPRHWNLRDHMKRVHNDLAPPESKATRYTSVPDEPTKGTKRKADSMDLGEDQESIATPPAENGRLHESRLHEHYHQNARRLLEIVKQLHDPRNASNIHLWSATNCITVMAQAIERINRASTSGNLRQTSRTE